MKFFHFIDPVKKQTYVEFSGALYRLKPEPAKALIDTFLKLGGVIDSNVSTLFAFPMFITSEIIEEVIRNTCFECGGLMQDGIAYDNAWVSTDDFGGDAGQPGSTMSKSGTAHIKKVRKCKDCGHSHT